MHYIPNKAAQMHAHLVFLLSRPRHTTVLILTGEIKRLQESLSLSLSPTVCVHVHVGAVWAGQHVVDLSVSTALIQFSSMCVCVCVHDAPLHCSISDLATLSHPLKLALILYY